jgi:transposase
MVERFNGRIQREGLGITVASHRDLETLLQGFNQAYNARRQRVLKGRSPDMLVRERLSAAPARANRSHDPPFDPCILPKALQVIARAKDVSHPNMIESWRRYSHSVRPHASLGYRPPAPELFMPALSRQGGRVGTMQGRAAPCSPSPMPATSSRPRSSAMPRGSISGSLSQPVLKGSAGWLDEGWAAVMVASWGLSGKEAAMWAPADRAWVGDFGSGQALSDDQYRLIEPLIPPAKPGGRPRTTDMRRLLDGLFYVVRTGCQWRHLPPPPAFPPWPTVYGYFRAFLAAGVWESMRHHLVVMVREGEGREASPTAAIIDTQSVKTTEKGALAAGMPPSG